jgi:hypothetical protein
VQQDATIQDIWQNILDMQHIYTMGILHIEKDGLLMNTLERCHIYTLSKNNLMIFIVIKVVHATGCKAAEWNCKFLLWMLGG